MACSVCVFLWLVLTAVCLTSSLEMADKARHIFRVKRSVTVVKFGHRPAGKRCMNFCSMMGHLCKNGASCVQDHNTCVAHCVCSEDWKGKWCNEEVVRTSHETGRHTSEDVSLGNAGGQTTERNRNTSDTTDLTTRRNEITAFTENFHGDNTLGRNEIEFEMGNKDSQIKQARLEECRRSCADGSCIEDEGSFVCVKKNEIENRTQCMPGYYCYHGTCDNTSKGPKCICEQNWLGTFCEKLCDLDCGDYGNCSILDHYNWGMECVCSWNYRGKFCEELIPVEKEEEATYEEIVFHWYVVGGSMAAVVMMLALLVTLPYLMWRRRMVFILKIVHYFQKYEEDDGKEYDAFVSFKSDPKDEEFVIHHLYPVLEQKLNFKLCLHFRDFLPGEAIANNIVRAIESSRRTIMVLSPAYVKSEWCRMEYQKAQHEMLKLKHKIIPIVLEDISSVKEMDKNLKCILNSVTYIQWPSEDNTKKQERFWKKLELSLPKKSTESASSTSLYSSSSSSSSNYNSPTYNYNSVSSVSSSCDHGYGSSGSLSTITASESIVQSSDSVPSSSESPPIPKPRKKKLRHFVDNLVRSKVFKRQDSSSSQAALVDEESGDCRGSLDSVADSVFTEGTDSVSSSPCSTPSTRSFTNTKSKNQNPFFCTESGGMSSDQDSLDELLSNSTNSLDVTCSCTLCESVSKSDNNLQELTTDNWTKSSILRRHNSDVSIHMLKEMKTECDTCNEMQKHQNQIVISPLEGTDLLKIQRLHDARRLSVRCETCRNLRLSRADSVKSRKEERKSRLLRRNRPVQCYRNKILTCEKPVPDVQERVVELDNVMECDKEDRIFVEVDICESV